MVAKREAEPDGDPATESSTSAVHAQRHPSWFEQNWDKIVMAALSIVVSGVIGFFTAIRTIDSELSSLRQEVAAVKAENAADVKDIERLRVQITQLSSLEAKVDRIEVTSGFAIRQYELFIGSGLPMLLHLRPAN